MATRTTKPKAAAPIKIVVPAVTMLSGGKDDSLETQTKRMYERVVLKDDKGKEIAVIYDRTNPDSVTRIEVSARTLVLAVLSAVLSGKASSTDGQAKWVSDHWAKFSKTGIAKLVLLCDPGNKGRKGPKRYEAPLTDWVDVAIAKYTKLIAPSVETHGIEPPAAAEIKASEKEPEVSVLSF
jgi:hypothetical protein